MLAEVPADAPPTPPAAPARAVVAAHARAGWVERLPAAVFLAYLASTVALFAWGPWQWPLRGDSHVLLYLALALVAFAAGSAWSLRRPPRGGEFPQRALVPLAAVVFAICLALLPLTLHASTGHWRPHLWDALGAPGAAYHDSWLRRESAGNWVWYLRILLGPAIGLALPLAVVERRRLPRSLAVVGVLLILGDLLLGVATGTNRLFGNDSVLVAWLLPAAHLSGRSPFRSRREATVVALLVATLWTSFAAFFQLTMQSRTGAPAQSGAMVLQGTVKRPSVPSSPSPSSATPAAARNTTTQTAVLATDRHLLVRLTPRGLRTGMLGITNYVTQGYFALSLALREPFVPMWGAGNSMFLTHEVERLPGQQDFARRSYPARVQARYGWDAYGRWSSVFPWWASDVGFPGALLVLALMAAGLTASWRDLVGGAANPFAGAAFAQLALFVAYVPANNQCFQAGESLTGFVAIVGAWIWFRRPRRHVAR